MANTITVTYKVNEDGSLSKISKGAEKAAKSTDKASKASDRYSKKQKGVAGATSNGTKAFSKMSQGISGSLVPAYATLAANVFALSAAFMVLSRNDAIGKLNEGLEYTGRLAGRNLGMVASKLQEITGNAISAEQAMRAVAVGTSAGFSEGQLESLTRVAKGASLALGRDMGDAMDRLIRGAAKLEPEILDELGIMVRLDDATKAYADTMRKSVDELTQFERRMAFTNAIIADGEQKFRAISEALNPSEYGQLSATFSDLTKTFIQFLNKGLAPVFGFLANNKGAFTAAIAAFGLGITKQLVGSIEEHTRASVENAKVSAQQAKARLKTIKPTKSMTKFMLKLANAENMSEKELRKLQRTSHAQVNMMNKQNPLYKSALKTRRALTQATFSFTIAQTKENAANALGMLTTHGFTLARAEHVLVMQAHQVATAQAVLGQDFLTAAMIRAKAAMVSAGAAAKFYGTALLMALPMIMAVISVVAILGPMIFNLFRETPNQLSEQLDKNKKRLEEFDNVLRVYVAHVKQAETATQSWHKTIKPLAGLFSQVSSAMGETNVAAQTKMIVAQAKAQIDLNRALKEQAELTKKMGAPGLGGKASGTAIMSSNLKVQSAKDKLERAAILTDKELLAIRDSNIESVAKLVSTMDGMILAIKADTDKTRLHAQALDLLNTKRAQAEAVLKTIINTEDKSLKSSEKHIAQINKLAQELESANAAYESFGEIVSKANKLTATPTFGLFAAEIDNVKEAVSSLNVIYKAKGGAVAEDEALRIMKAYGLQAKQIMEVVDSSTALDFSYQGSGAIVKRMETNKEVVERFRDELEATNRRAKDLQLTLAKTSITETILGEANASVFKEITENAREALDIKRDTLKLTKKGGEDELTAKLAVLDAENALLVAIKKRSEVLAGKAAESGMGAAATASLAAQGNVSAAVEHRNQLDNDPDATDADKKEADSAVATARVDQARATLRGVADDMAALGPEGASMSAAIDGVMNIGTAMSTAFETMGDASASMGAKVQAGLGVATAMIGAMAQMQKAATADKLRAIDQEIAAEKSRDGQSSASVAKMKGLEQKKTAVQRKAFEDEKKMKIAQTIISTAQGAIAAYTSLAMIPIVGPALGAAAAAMVVSMGAKQVAMIQATSFSGGGSVGGGPSAISVGSRSNTVDLAKGENAGGEQAYMRGQSGTGTGMDDFTPAFTGYKNRAAGGPAGFIVGEQGPELFVPEVPGNIVPAGETSSMGGTTNVNFSIQAVDSAGVEELLMNQRGNIIGMLREAANEHGEMFLENVEEKTL